MPVKRPNVIFIVGPTAIGKTSVALKLAKKIGGEIISCDSMQVYKGIRVLSQAPSVKDIKKIPYHLAGFLDPKKEFSVAHFIKLSRSLIDDIISRKRIPIIAGGTGLYVKGLVDGLFPTPGADLKFRERMEGLAHRYGNKYLHKKLQKIDKESADLLHYNDTRRVVRALEIWHITGKTMTELKRNTKGISEIYDIKIFGLTAPRNLIYSRINNRVDGMIGSGALKEVKRLNKKILSKTAKAIIGLKELSGFLNKVYSLDTAVETMKMNTRRYAKRQMTWFRADKRIKWFDVTKMSEKEIASAIRASQ